ncbi:MAG: hypothetical protein ACKV22_18995 [Bryobacteraceae bacterium]
MRRILLGGVLCSCLFGQSSPNAGLTSEWDIRITAKALVKHSEQLLPLLDNLRPAEWRAKGASPLYEKQLESARIQAKAMAPMVAQFEKNVEKLSAALDIFFRLESLDSTIGSLVEGARRYQNPAFAELLEASAVESSNARNQLRQYLTDLTALKEQEYQVMDKEAQRCRGMLVRQAPAPPQPKPAPGKNTK